MAETTFKQKTNLQKILSRFFARKIAVVGMVIILLLALLAVFGSYLTSYAPDEINALERYEGPSAQHIFGTDDLGRDTFARIVDGAQITLIIMVGSVSIALIFGTLFGLLAGYVGGALDTILSGLMDSLWAFPAIILAMAINTALGSNIRNIFIAIGIVYIPDFFRVVRSRVISIREMEYVTGARAIGLRDWIIMGRYVLPNLYSTLVVQTTLCCAKAVIAEASLSFLGLGVPLPHASWGTMLKNGYAVLLWTPWLSIFPGLMIMLLVMSLNLLGDGLRDALDVRIRAD